MKEGQVCVSHMDASAAVSGNRSGRSEHDMSGSLAALSMSFLRTTKQEVPRLIRIS